ncbi:uncharacterized protein LOC100840618 [Brachypodium distachyon]|uniref:Uncharacterized protein n=1 Tax=Brachypodium distachyon TaxID=15368 RepID=I1HLM6_BRADI|nr:uncharacterized protein LOC100840618 [Brachypodium distachyon]KQK07403.1 hypothetical protein BRADI_2g35100v3 [Brachypodium distachyon]|eukprot:XP_003568897.1 uncharacterized protein LOC100840618 [Brachypodium distachyon]
MAKRKAEAAEKEVDRNAFESEEDSVGSSNNEEEEEEEELVDNEHANLHPEKPSERLGAASASARVTTEVGGSGSINLEVSVPASPIQSFCYSEVWISFCSS